MQPNLNPNHTTKFWRNTIMMFACFMLSYLLTFFWLIPSIGESVAALKAPLVCLIFLVGCSFGDRAQRYRESNLESNLERNSQARA
jgi:amino acid permease